MLPPNDKSTLPLYFLRCISVLIDFFKDTAFVEDSIAPADPEQDFEHALAQDDEHDPEQAAWHVVEHVVLQVPVHVVVHFPLHDPVHLPLHPEQLELVEDPVQLPLQLAIYNHLLFRIKTIQR